MTLTQNPRFDTEARSHTTDERICRKDEQKEKDALP